MADYGFDACLHEDVFEVPDCRAGGGGKGAAFVGVVLDEVDGGVYALDEADERPGVGRGVIQVFYHAVFEADAPGCLLLVCLDCRDKFGQRVLCRDGHDSPSFAVAGGMERDGQSHLQGFVGESLDNVRDAAGADGDVALSDVCAGVMVEYACRADDFVVVVERFTHAHVDDVVDFFGASGGLIDLVGDFGGGEVSLESASAGGAQCTRHAAAGLAGDAEGFSLFFACVGEEDRFEAYTVGGGEKKLDRAVGIDERLDGFKLRYKISLPGEAPAKVFRQGGDLVDLPGVMSVDEREKVLCQKLPAAELCDELPDLLECQVFEVFAHGAYCNAWRVEGKVY